MGVERNYFLIITENGLNSQLKDRMIEWMKNQGPTVCCL
jgi:hypothetical protein